VQYKLSVRHLPAAHLMPSKFTAGQGQAGSRYCGLAARSDDQSKLLNERNKRISELEVQIQQRQESEAELIVRQHICRKSWSR
jgi:hypothetical protein